MPTASTIKILFVCGSLQQGRDGVGDYTTRLARYVAGEHVQVALLALHDAFVQDCIEEELAGQVPIQMLRLGATCSRRKANEAATRFIKNFDPTWVSIQFVPFAFNNKGLLFGLATRLKKLAGHRRLHLMYHEGWVGAEGGWKRRLYAALQQFSVVTFLKLLQPSVVHTHLPFYQARLQQAGLPVKMLPLFSNIEVTANGHAKGQGVFKTAFFSQVELSAPVVGFLQHIDRQLKAKNIPHQLLIIGGRANAGNALVAGIQKATGIQNIHTTGFIQTSEVSAYVSNVTLGVTPVPRHALGKSGSVAAFLAHGVPVAAPVVHSRFQTQDIGFFCPELSAAIVTEASLEALPAATMAAGNAGNLLSLATIGNIFLNDLHASS